MTTAAVPAATRLLNELQAARLAAGQPSCREIGRRAKVSHSITADIFGGRYLGSLRVTLCIAEAIGADAIRVRDLWSEANADRFPDLNFPRTVTLTQVLEEIQVANRRLEALLEAAGIKLPEDEET